MSAGNSKGPDEVFCESCGEPIKKAAELCPHCGVRPGNVGGGGSPGGGTTGGATSSHDPSQYETTVSDRWWIGVLLGTGGWAALLALASVDANLGAAGGFAILVVWVWLPLAAYFDAQYVRANSDWNPETVLWIVLLLVWIVNVPAGAFYLYRRHEALGTP
jgi:hypothetical protein